MTCEQCGREFDPIGCRWLCPHCGFKANCCEGAPQPYIEAAESALVRAATRGHPLAEDARQEAAIRAWELSEAQPGLPGQYLRQAARNRALDVMRGKPQFGAHDRSRFSGTKVTLQALSVVVALPDLEPRYEDDIVERRSVEEFLEGLTADQSRVARMLVEGFTQEEIAHAMGCSKGKVWNLLSVVRTKLSQHLGRS